MSLVFWILAAIAVLGGLAAMLLRSTVHCALALTVAFAGIALLFLNLGAQFAGFVQILVYVGAVAILLVFAILLTRGSEPPTHGVFSTTWLAGLVIAAAVFAVLGSSVLSSQRMLPHESTAPAAPVVEIGQALAGPYILPLEMIAVLLTAALIGAVIIALHEKEGEQ